MAIAKNIPPFFAPWCLALEKSVGAVIYYREGAKTLFLLLHYPSGHWEFPRGHMEKGENEEQTMRREVTEETGITELIVDPTFRTTMSFSYLARGTERKERIAARRCVLIRKKVVFYLAATSKRNIALSDEHRTAVWLSFDEALARITYANGRRVLQEAYAHLAR